MNETKLKILEGRRIILRPITEDDTADIVRWRNSEEVMQYFIFREPFTAEMHTNWLRTKVASGQVIQYIILRKEDNKAVGSVYLKDIDMHNQSAEYGIFIGESSARGRGLGSETCKLFTDFAFAELGLHRISLRLLAKNKAAHLSYERAGFLVEGVFADMVKLDGEFTDVIFMARINEEDE